MASIYDTLLEQKKVFYIRKEFNGPTELSWYTDMAAVSLFWNTNMDAVFSCENALLTCHRLFNFVNDLRRSGHINEGFFTRKCMVVWPSQKSGRIDDGGDGIT